MSVGRPPGRLDGDWLVATMVYSSPSESGAPGFDNWYWKLLALIPKAKRLLLVVGAYDSDGTIKELLSEAKKRQVPVTVHFCESGPLRKAFETGFSDLATVVEDVDTFTEEKGISLAGYDEISFDF
ncbi:hypothetical protein HY251_00660 [bacterium]|nr:hypothetical protein [bacterium]